MRVRHSVGSTVGLSSTINQVCYTGFTDPPCKPMKRHLLCKAVLTAVAAVAALSPALAATKYHLTIPAKGMVVKATSTPTSPTTPTTPTPPAKVAAWTVTAPAAFASTLVGAYASPDGTVVVKNIGEASGTPAVPTIAGENSADFAVGTNGCAAAVAINTTCSITVRFKPTAAGTRAAKLTIGEQSVDLSGIGQAGATDPYYAQVVSLLHMDGQPATQRISSQKGPALVAADVAGLAPVSKFGPTSLHIGPGWAAQAQYTDSTIAQFSSGNFTIELWLNPSATGPRGGGILGHWGIGPSNDPHWLLHMDPSLRVTFYAGSTAVADPTALPQNTWVHLAVTRQGNVLTLWKNGVAVASQPFAIPISYNAARATRFGVWDDYGSWVEGYVDEVRITKGVARYTTNFTAPTEAFPNQ